MSHQKSSDIKSWNWDGFLWNNHHLIVEVRLLDFAQKYGGPQGPCYTGWLVAPWCSMMFHPAENGPTPTWSILILNYWIDEHQHSPVHLLVTFTRAEIKYLSFPHFFLKNKVTHILKYDQIWTPEATIYGDVDGLTLAPWILFISQALRRRVWDWRASYIGKEQRPPGHRLQWKELGSP